MGKEIGAVQCRPCGGDHLAGLGVHQFHRDIADAKLPVFGCPVAVQVVKYLSGDGPLRAVSEGGGRGSAGRHTHGDRVGAGALKSLGIGLLHCVSPGHDLGKEIGAIRLCQDRANDFSVRVQKFHLHAGDAAFVLISVAVAVKVVKDRSG